MRFLKTHWRLIFPILLMVAIFCFSADAPSSSDAKSQIFANFLNLPHDLTRKIAHFVLFAALGAAWYFYLRKLGRFTPAFTFFATIAFASIFAISDEFHQTFIPGRSGQISDILLDSTAAIFGTAIFATIFYVTSSKQERLARKKQVEKIWRNNQKTLQKLFPKSRKH